MFTCCHPAIHPKVQVPLTLREVCGLKTEEIARAFLTAPATMSQRIVRGKAKIRNAITSLTRLVENFFDGWDRRLTRRQPLDGPSNLPNKNPNADS